MKRTPKKKPSESLPGKSLSKRKPKKNSWKRVKRDAVDNLWSKIVRHRDNGECQAPWEWTKRDGGPRPDGRCPRDEYRWQIEAHHIFGRGKFPVRYAPRSGVSLCKICHDWAGSHKTEATAWAKERLGDEYELLRILSESKQKTDKESWRMKLKAMLKEMET